MSETTQYSIYWHSHDTGATGHCEGLFSRQQAYRIANDNNIQAAQRGRNRFFWAAPAPVQVPQVFIDALSRQSVLRARAEVRDE